jgi:hypothetical protein
MTALLALSALFALALFFAGLSDDHDDDDDPDATDDDHRDGGVTVPSASAA